MAFTAPYGSKVDKPDDNANPLPWFDQGKAHDAINSHGLFVRALGEALVTVIGRGTAGRIW